MGFDVRKCYTNTSDVDELVTSSRFVCSNQGSRAENKRFCVAKRNRAYTIKGFGCSFDVSFDHAIFLFMFLSLCISLFSEFKCCSRC